MRRLASAHLLSMPREPASPEARRMAASLVEGVLAQLERAEASEPNPHFQDDYRISWITVLRASCGESIPHVSATYTVLGMHPDKVWPSIVARRRARLGSHYEEFFGLN